MQNSKKLLYDVIQLMEHVVVVFDLYQDKKKMSEMYEFLKCVINLKGSSFNIEIILDIWKIRLFRLHCMSKNVN